MMQFDRSDICEAYYLFASHYHSGQGSKVYEIFGRLEKIKFHPRPTLDEKSLSENGKAIYDNLVGEWQNK